MSEKEQLILKSILKNPNITTPLLVTQTKFARATVERALKKLKELNLLRRIGADKNGHWEVLSHPQE